MNLRVATLVALFAAGCTGVVTSSDEPSSPDSAVVPAVYDTPGGLYSARSTATRPTYARSTGFFVADGKLYDRSGGEFVIRGVNNGHAWYDSYGRDYAYDALDAIAGYGFNAVRIVWETDQDPAQLRRIIARVVQLEMIPMVELHDVTGSSSSSRLLDMARYYASSQIKPILVDYEQYLLVNIANEWSGADFAGGYAAAIEHLRAAGINHTLVIDANGWGQNIASILADGRALLDADPEHNLLFDVHMYESYDDPAYIVSRLEEVVNAGLPLVVGEFGFQHGNPIESIDVATIMAECERHGIGYMAWSWKGNSAAVEYLDMSRDWGGSELTDWGRDVIFSANGVMQTARKARVFLPDGECVPQCDARECGPDPVCGLSCGAACADGASCSGEGTCVADSAAACPAVRSGERVGTVSSGSLVEISGIAVSRANAPSILWAHNDSGDSARIFAMTIGGRRLGTYILAGASARDYEDIAIDDDYLYVGDIGDNAEARSSVTIYRVAEPAVSPTQSAIQVTLDGVDAMELVYPDRSHNAETLLVDPVRGDLYIVTKEGSGNSRVFVAPAPFAPGQRRELTEVARLPFGSAQLPGNRYATGGDVSANGDAIVLRTYDRAYLWTRRSGEALWEAFDRDACPVPARTERQGEAIAFDASGRGYYTVSEGSNQAIYLHAGGGAAPPEPPAPDPEPAGDWIVRNDYEDQNNGSRLEPAAGGVRFVHRQWGQTQAWLINSGATRELVAGRRYRVSFELADDPNSPVASIGVGFARGWDTKHPDLVQAAASAVDSGDPTTMAAVFTAGRSGALHLALDVRWSQKPSVEVVYELASIAVAEVGSDFEPAGDWVLRNDYRDQEIGSSVTREGAALRIHHRQWGLGHAWLVNTGDVLDVVAGADYRVSFAFLDDPVHGTPRINVGLATTWGDKAPELVQATVPAVAVGDGQFAARIAPVQSGAVHLVLELDWDQKPAQSADYYVSDIVVTAGAAGRVGADGESEGAGFAAGCRAATGRGSALTGLLIAFMVLIARRFGRQ